MRNFMSGPAGTGTGSLGEVTFPARGAAGPFSPPRMPATYAPSPTSLAGARGPRLLPPARGGGPGRRGGRFPVGSEGGGGAPAADDGRGGPERRRRRPAGLGEATLLLLRHGGAGLAGEGRTGAVRDVALPQPPEVEKQPR